MRARVIDRQSGEAVDEIEADSVYGLFQALLDWAERRGVPRFQAPLLYRTDRSAAAPPVPVGPDDASAEALPLPLFDKITAEPPDNVPRPKRTRHRKRSGEQGTGPVDEQPRLF